MRQVGCGQSGKCSYLMKHPCPLSDKAYNESVKTICKVVTDVTDKGIFVAQYEA
jgi:hypothetical protein